MKIINNNFNPEFIPEICKKDFRLDNVVKIVLPIIASLSILSFAGSIAAIVILPSSALAISAIVITSIFVGIILISKLATFLYPHLPEKLQNLIDRVDIYFRELLAFITFCCIYLFPALNDLRSNVKDTTPLLLIHGAYCNSSVWHYPVSRLKNHVGPIYSPNFGSLSGFSEDMFILEAAERIAKMVNDEGILEIDLCGYSAGGSVCSYLAKYINELTSRNWFKDFSAIEPFCSEKEYIKRTNLINHKLQKVKIRKVVTIASLADCTYSPHDKSSVQFLHFGSVFDPLIPFEKCVCNVTSHKNVKLDNHGHFSSIYSDQMIDQMIQFLTT